MTMLTDDELWKNDAIMAANSGYGANFDTLRELTRAILAAHTAKLLAGVKLPEYKYIDRHDVPKEGMRVYTQDQLLAYGDARDQAGYLRGLDGAKQACLQKHANGNWKHDTREECADAIEELKVEP